MPNPMADEHIATIASGYAQRPDVTVDNILELVRRLRGAERAETALPTETAVTRTGLAPALPVDEAVTQSMVFCLCCGRGFKMLKRHLNAEHGMTEAEYRATFNLADSFPLVAPDYSERKADYARKAGLGTHKRDTTDRDRQMS